MAGTPATWGIEAQRDNVADADGLAVSRFRAAGAHFLGKTNVPVDLADVQSYNPIYGTSNNPWNTERTPGGSSGGSAAAMAAGFSALEAGSDIGGSIRTPAHFCGVFGHKPTWGIIPMSGHEIVPHVPDPDLSVCGPLARSAEDLATALDIMAGPTEREATGWQLALPEPGFKSLSDLRVAVWPTEDIAPVSAETQGRVHMVAETLARFGATVSDTARPDFDVRKAHLVYQNLVTAVMSSGQSASQIEKIRQRVENLDPEDQSADAVAARAAVMSHRDWIRHDFRRERLRRAWDAFFQDWDVLLCPNSRSRPSPTTTPPSPTAAPSSTANLAPTWNRCSGPAWWSPPTSPAPPSHRPVERRSSHRRASGGRPLPRPQNHRMRPPNRPRNRRLHPTPSLGNMMMGLWWTSLHLQR